MEIGKVLGACVIAGASTAEKLAVAREHGADDLINYTTEPLTERVMALTQGAGVDVCFDPVGGDFFDAALSSLGWGGRILLVGFVGGSRAFRRIGYWSSSARPWAVRCAIFAGTRWTKNRYPAYKRLEEIAQQRDQLTETVCFPLAKYNMVLD